MNPALRQRLDDALRQHGRQPTAILAEVYDALLATPSHPTAEEISTAIGRDASRISSKAVDEALEILLECGLIHKRCFGAGPIRFDANVTPHSHMVDPESGVLMDLPVEMAGKLGLDLSPQLLAEIRRRTGFKVVGLQLELIGHAEDIAGPGGQSVPVRKG